MQCLLIQGTFNLLLSNAREKKYGTIKRSERHVSVIDTMKKHLYMDTMRRHAVWRKYEKNNCLSVRNT